MYLVNFLNLQTAQQLFVTTARYRTGVSLLGAKNGSNTVYTLPSGDKFTHNLPYLSIHVYFNGQLLRLLDDYTISESGGSGSGYDIVALEVPLIARDVLLVDYVSVGAPP